MGSHQNVGLEVEVVEVGNRMLFAIDLNLGVGIWGLGVGVGVRVHMIGSIGMMEEEGIWKLVGIEQSFV